MLPNHHAFVAYGSPAKAKEFAAYMAKECGVSAAGNPDFHLHDYSSAGEEDASSFGVDEAHTLTELAGRKSTGGKKVFIIAAQSLTREAQNALLKTLEEPTPNTVFAFLVPHGALIGTVLSRLMTLSWAPSQTDETRAKAFIGASAPERSKLIAGILKDKDKEATRELLDGVERLLMSHIEKPSVRRGLEELARMRSYAGDRSSSLKMILEHLCVVLPKI